MQKIEHLARAIIFDKSRSEILLVNNKKYDDTGYFVLPGGHIEFGERATQALVREMKEELLCDIFIEKFVCTIDQIYNRNGKQAHAITLLFKASYSGEIIQMEKGIIPCWIKIKDLANIDLRPECMANLIHDISSNTYNNFLVI